MKTCLRDASLQGRTKADVERLLKGFSAWIADVSTLYAVDLSIQNSDNGNTQKLKFATQKFCERLCERNGLVPLSKSKRAPSSQPLVYPPNQEIWAPLILHFDQHNEYFLEELLSHMLIIVNDDTAAESDPTFLTTIATWVLWIVDTLGDETLRRDCIRSLLNSAGPAGGNPITRNLVNSLALPDEALQSLVAGLLAPIKPKPQASWQAGSMKELEARQLQLKQALLSETPPQSTLNSSHLPATPSDQSGQLPPGWYQIPQSSWVPCPIGVPITM